MYYVVGDTNGNIIARYDMNFHNYTLPSDVIEVSADIWTDSLANPGKYIIQSGVCVLAPLPTDQELLSNAKSSKLLELASDFSDAINQGFLSSADGTSRTYALDSTAMAKWNGVMSVINSGSLTTNVVIKDFGGNQVPLSPTQFTQMVTDGFTYYNQQEQKLWSLEEQVNSATTADQANTITWDGTPEVSGSAQPNSSPTTSVTTA